jgi:hypothetical protein
MQGVSAGVVDIQVGVYLLLCLARVVAAGDAELTIQLDKPFRSE